MGRFKKPEAKNKRLKALIYGPTGCGKTVTALQFPNPAVIDGEKGTDHYADDFTFDVTQTSTIDSLVDSITDLLNDPEDYKTLVIDPFTVFTDNQVIEWSKKLKLKKGNPDYELQPADHGPLKMKRKEIVDMILGLDLNIVCTARIKQKYRQEGRNFMVPDGYKPDLPEDIPYLFDTIIRIEVGPDGETRIAHCEKDRTNKLPKIFQFTYDKMVEYIGMDSLDRKADPNIGKKILDNASGRTHDTDFNGQKIKTAGIEGGTIEAILSAANQADIDQEGLSRMLSDSYNVTSLFDLKDDEGRFLIKTLQNL